MILDGPCVILSIWTYVWTRAVIRENLQVGRSEDVVISVGLNDNSELVYQVRTRPLDPSVVPVFGTGLTLEEAFKELTINLRIQEN